MSSNNQPLNFSDPDGMFRNLTIVFWALLFGQLSFLAVATIVMQGSDVGADAELAGTFRIIVPIAAVAFIAAGQFIARMLITGASQETIPSSKLGTYFTATLVRLGMLEAVSLLGIVIYFVTADYMFVIISGVVLVLFVLNKPNKEKGIQELRLSDEELAMLSNSEG